MANSLNDHNGSADVDTQLGSYRFSRFVTKSTHFPHSHSFSLSSSLWKVLNTFFPRKYHFPRKQTVRYSLLFFALTFYFWGVRFSFLLRSVVCLTNDFLFVSFQETVDFFFSRENGQEVPSILVSHRTCLLRKSWFTGSGFYGSTRW